MEDVDNSSNFNSRGNKNLKIMVTILIVLLIIVASVAAFLYIQLMQSNNNSYSKPRYVQLLTPQQVSAATSGSNCSTFSSQNPTEFYNVSNPTGLQELELISCSSVPNLIVLVFINGFNSSSSSEFAYQNSQLGSSVYNFTQSGTFTSSENYFIFGTCNSSNYCLTLTGLTISSLYVVRITASVEEVGQTQSVLNASMVRVMLGAQLSAIQSG